MNDDLIRDYCYQIRGKTSRQDYYGGLEIAGKMIQEFPDYEKGYYYTGVCLFGLEKYEDAIESYNTAIGINPLYAKAYFNLGLCYQQLHQYDEALVNFGKSLILFTNKGNISAKERCINAIRYIDVKREIE